MPTSPKPRQTRSRGSRESQGNQSRGKAADSQGNQDDSLGKETTPTAAANEPAASGPASAAAASSSLLTNPGAAFEGREIADDGEAGLQGEVLDAPGGLPLLDDFWTPERARYLLNAQGAVTHAAIGVGQTDWIWHESELRAVDQPLANSLNRVEMLRRFAPYADVLGGVAGAAAYVARSRRERAEVIAAGGPPVEVPVSGFDAAGEPAQPSDAAAARRRSVISNVLRGRERAPESEPPPAAAGGPIEWRVGE